ncbi:hypothetical protein [Aporhodopirellula aestuarii]|uniref:Uncharacterized protein n=1 Tax=Aporhodopirellula aestuarii TaxID=2950107 RepID=A0ABT0U760_9BACT|nr:hypothetical protein [Aporhodopirellula aestuarii]MCM2372385.1 hypothetical protein [Aporhodopirellula aestuarii]
MRPFPLGPLYESQNRIHQEFLDFAEQWQRTRDGWRDEPARKFEQESLCDLAPTLTRVAAAMQNFADACRLSDQLLLDPDQNEGA